MIGRTRKWKLRGGVGGSLVGALAALAFASLAAGDPAPGGTDPAAPAPGTAANGALLQPDGRIVAVGTSDGRLALARYRADGSLDPSFGDGGLVVTDADPHAVDEISAAALQPDGKLVAAGRSGKALLVARYEPDGSLDPSFGHDGVVTEPCCGATSVVVAPDGGVVLDGPSQGTFQVLRLNPDGSLDKSFGDAGAATLDFGSPAGARAVALEPDGAILAAGATGDGSIALARLDATGSPDPSFGSGGQATSTALQSVHALSVDSDGSLLVGGDGPSGPAVARFDSTGALDPSFGAAGVATLPASGTPRALNALALEPDGNIAAGGSDGGSALLAMLTSSGGTDPAFGTAGAIQQSTVVPPVAAVMPTPGNGIVTAGAASDGFALARFLADGSFDPSFGSGGTVVTSFPAAAPASPAPVHPRHTVTPAAAPRGHHHRKPHRVGSPHPVPAWYVNADNVDELKRFAAADACSFARSQPKKAHRSLILDFGGARAYGHGSFGAAVNNASFEATNQQIRAAMKVAADAYASCHERGQGKIAYAVTNHFKYRGTAVLAHEIGVRQASTVNHVSDYMRSRGYYPAVRAGVAGDIETGYWGPKYSKAMVDGAKAGWNGGYIDFGTAGGCPPHPGIKGPGCFNGWSLDDVAHVSNSGGGDPLPEVYYRGGPRHFDQAAQWVHVARNWNQQHTTPYVFAGTTGSTEFSGMTPGESWRRMKNKAPGHVGRELVNFKQDHWVAKRSADAAP